MSGNVEFVICKLKVIAIIAIGYDLEWSTVNQYLFNISMHLIFIIWVRYCTVHFSEGVDKHVYVFCEIVFCLFKKLTKCQQFFFLKVISHSFTIWHFEDSCSYDVYTNVVGWYLMTLKFTSKFKQQYSVVRNRETGLWY